MLNPKVGPHDDYNDEAEGLLHGLGSESKQAKKKLLWISLFAFLTVLAVIGLSASWASAPEETATTKRNVIFMISDGFGPTSETFARSYYQYINDLPYNYTLPLDEILVGSSRTRSSDSLVTDSAAGATAFSCGIKTYNTAIGVDPDEVPCGTVLESAKALGLATGLVVTSRITHATPASFSAHVVDREMEPEIAVQQIGGYVLGRQVDLLFGGGRCFFLPNTTDGSCRLDDLDVIAEAKRRDFKYLETRKEFNSITIEKKSLPILGLFTLDHMSYEIDRDPMVEPSLKEMSLKALQLLEKANSDSDKGFFLMIEGSRIDMAGHSNDAPTHVHDILAYHETISAVREYVDSHPGTVMISVSDHETGGLGLGRQLNPLSYPDYLWYPDVLTKVRNSSEVLSLALKGYNGDDKVGFIKQTILLEGLGIDDFTDDEIAGFDSTENMEYYLANLTSARAQLGWTTHGHTGVDVNLYAYGLNAEKLAGNHENTELGEFLIDFLGLDLGSITKRLNQGNVTFHLNKHPNITRFNVDKLKHYHSH